MISFSTKSGRPRTNFEPRTVVYQQPQFKHKNIFCSLCILKIQLKKKTQQKNRKHFRMSVSKVKTQRKVMSNLPGFSANVAPSLTRKAPKRCHQGFELLYSHNKNLEENSLPYIRFLKVKKNDRSHGSDNFQRCFFWKIYNLFSTLQYLKPASVSALR